MSTVRDVIVIGAGPAGCGTAARLHQRGVRDVLVLDRADFPRDKPCGGGLTGHCDDAFAALGLRLTVPHVAAAYARIRFGAFERSVRLPRPINVIRRIEFDASLVEQVRELGIDVATGARASSVEVGAESATVRLASGESLHARVVIGADGVGSIVRKHLNGRAGAAPLRLFMQEVDGRAGNDLLFDFTPMLAGLRGYVWVFPVNDRCVNIGVLHYPTTPQGATELLSAMRAGVAREGIAVAGRSGREAQGWGVWGYDPRAPVSGPRLLTVGDAAGIDALTGEGIAVALEQAQIAGDAAAHGLASGDFSFAGYRHALRHATVGRELMVDRWLSRWLYQPGDGWRHWMQVLLYDTEFVALYAARIAGTVVLADRKPTMARAIALNWFATPSRRRRLAAAMRGFESGTPSVTVDTAAA